MSTRRSARPSRLLHRNRSQGFVALARTEELERLVVAVLHREETVRVFQALFGAQQLALFNAAIGDKEAGRLAVAAMGNGRCVAAERDKARGFSVRKVERPDAVEGIQLGVQQIATVFCREQLTLVDERKVIERVVVMITEHEQRDLAIK